MNTKIGIIGAMDDEISMYIDHIRDMKENKWKIFTFYEGKFNDRDVVLVKSGVGKVFAAMICQYLIDHYRVGMVLFTGVGGSLNKTLRIGDVVVSTDAAHHDFDATELGFKRGQISYTDYRFFPADDRLVNLALTADIPGHKIIKGRILTGDQFFSKRERKKHKYLYDELQGDCIEMEGAAVAQVCNMNEIPYLVIRTMSDNADDNAVIDYNTFKSIVAHNSFRIVEHIVKSPGLEQIVKDLK